MSQNLKTLISKLNDTTRQAAERAVAPAEPGVEDVFEVMRPLS